MNILSAPTSLGNRPYESDGTARWTTQGPGRLLDQGLRERLRARDLGEIRAADYRDFVRSDQKIRNEDLVLRHVLEIAKVLEGEDDFTLILGGDCSVLLGSLLGLSRGRDLGLVYLDGHTDFNTPETTETGAVAGMDLALATGRGASPLATLRGSRPLVRDDDVVTVGIRDGDFGQARIHRAKTPMDVVDHLGDREFFIHVDVDVLDPSFMPFVDSPEPGGLDPATLVSFLKPLVRNPRAAGLEMTIYDPRYDHDSRGAALLANILEESFKSRA